MTVDPNFLIYAIDCKRDQITTADVSEVPRITAEINAALKILQEAENGD